MTTSSHLIGLKTISTVSAVRPTASTLTSRTRDKDENRNTLSLCTVTVTLLTVSLVTLSQDDAIAKARVAILVSAESIYTSLLHQLKLEQ